MKNVTLSLDEHVLAQARNYAREHHTTLNALIRDLLERTINEDRAGGGLGEFLRLLQDIPADSRGKTWTRDALYED